MKLLFLLSVLACLSGCATILQPGPDKISVNSKPEGARVLLNGQVVGQTPCMINVNRDQDFNVRLEKDGFEPMTVERNKVLSGWFIGNLLLGGIIGGGVDLATHNQGHYSNEPIYMEWKSPENRSAASTGVDHK